MFENDLRVSCERLAGIEVGSAAQGRHARHASYLMTLRSLVGSRSGLREIGHSRGLSSPALRSAVAVVVACCGVPVQSQAETTAATAASQGELGVRAFVNQVRASNRAIKAKQAERDIASTGVVRAEASFQPTITVTTQRSRSRQANTLEEDLIRQNLGVYERVGTDYSAGVSQLLSNGAKVEGKVTLSSFLTNIKQAQNPEAGSDHRTFYGLSVTQPLLRDAGQRVATARLRVAQIDTAVAGAASGDTESSVVAEAVFAYWDLMLAQRRLDAASERLRMGQRLLTESRNLNRQGRLADSDVVDVQSNVSRFEAGLSEARLGVLERVNRLRTLMNAPRVADGATLTASESLPEPSAETPSFEQAMRIARDKRDDLRMRRLAVEREDLQVEYSRNQALPRLDVVAGYGLNGLGANEVRALRWQQDFPAWNVGLQLSMPLGPNKQADADIAAARVRRADAQLQLQALEVAVAADIDTGISMLQSTAERWRLLRDVAQREQAQLEQERRRQAAGRSDVREILMREDRAINARIAVVEQQMAWVKAQVLLDAAQGVLLERYK